MQVIDAPNFVDCLVAAIATSPTGEVGAVIVARTIAHPDASHADLRRAGWLVQRL